MELIKTNSSQMSIESLANELLLDVFDYFPPVELLLAFHGLNTRLNDLLSLHFQAHPLDCRAVSRRDFVDVCQNIVPSITDRITSIHLSTDDDTPDQVGLFFSFGLHFSRFTNLRSLSLSDLRWSDSLSTMLSGCLNLTSLLLQKCYFELGSEQSQACISIIWRLPKLQHCYLDQECWNDLAYLVPAQVSSSLQVLSITNGPILFQTLLSLLTRSPNLHSLTVNVGRVAEHDISKQTPLPIRSLNKLNVKFNGTLSTLTYLLQHFPNVSKLQIELDRTLLDGYQLQTLITQCLPRLVTFRLLMCFSIEHEHEIVGEIDRLIGSFQTSFWTDDHQWYVRCDYHSSKGSAYLYTLPFPLVKFAILPCDASATTCPLPKRGASFKQVRSLKLDYPLVRFASQTSMQFTHIHHLDLSYPFDEIVWTVIPDLDRLQTMEIFLSSSPDTNDQSLSDLRQLLERATHLCSLTIDYVLLSELAIVPIANRSIRRLNLLSGDWHYYGSECVALIQAFLGLQCEVLCINIEDWPIAVELVDKLPQLRALTFVCQNDTWADSHEVSIDDDLLLRLRERLPTGCSILRDESEPSVVHLWIR